MTLNRRWYATPLLVGALMAASAYGNGINPPRPAGSKTVEAVCTDRKSGSATTIQRVRIMIDEPSGALELKLGKATAQTLQISQVTRVQIPSARPVSEGFAKATLELSEPGYEGPGFVRVRVKGKPVRITGFSPALERVDIALETCKELALKASASPESERRGVPRL